MRTFCWGGRVPRSIDPITNGRAAAGRPATQLCSPVGGLRNYTEPVSPRFRQTLTAFGFFTATGLLMFTYRYLEYRASRQNVSPWFPFIDQMTGAWLAALLFPAIARFARRYPLNRSNLAMLVPLHLCAMVAYSAAHTSMMWASRILLYRLLGFQAYDYGI